MIKGEGMPIFDSDLYGDLYVEYKVVFPLELSSKMRRSEFLLPSTSPRPLNLCVSELYQAFNNGYSGGNDGRDEL